MEHPKDTCICLQPKFKTYIDVLSKKLDSEKMYVASVKKVILQKIIVG